MKLMIDIDEDYYAITKQDVKVYHNDFKPYKMIANGTPLPKGHGRLIDADYYKKYLWGYIANSSSPHNIELDELLAIIDNVPTIIEADRGEQE